MTANRIEAFQTAFRNLQLQPLIQPKLVIFEWNMGMSGWTI
jgi:hypothetical protein